MHDAGLDGRHAAGQATVATAVFEHAPAKINLALHVTGRREDGYHLLDSIVSFTEEGDRLDFSAADHDSFAVTGRFAPALSATPQDLQANLVLTARDRLRAAAEARGLKTFPTHISLEKNLPIASGIGGGSADAAATLRGLVRLWRLTLPEAELAAIALSLGADVPMCLAGRPLRAEGIGETITPLPELPSFAMVLGNPLKAVSTPAIFRSLSSTDHPALPDTPEGDATETWLSYLARQRNDLQAPACALLCEIDEMRAMIEATGAILTRMSGSGATCFGIYDGADAARSAAESLSRMRPDWYFVATRTIAG